MLLLADSESKQLLRSLWDDHSARLPEIPIGDVLPVYVAPLRKIRNPWDSRLFTPLDPTDYTIRAAITKNSLPVVGKWPITYGADTSEAEISANPSYAELFYYLNLLDSVIAAGGVDVTGESGFFTISFNNVGVRTMISGDPTNLVPVSLLPFTRVTIGDASHREVQALRIMSNASALAILATNSAAPTIATPTVIVQGDATHNHKVRVTLPADRWGGTWTFSALGATSDLIGWYDNEKQVQTLLEAITGVGSGNVTASQETEDSFIIAFKGARANAAITGISASGTALKTIGTKSGVLDLRNAASQFMLNGNNYGTATFELELTPPAGTPTKIVRDVLLVRPAIEADTEDTATEAGRVVEITVPITSANDDLDAIPVVFTGLSAAPQIVGVPWMEKADDADTNIYVVSIDALTASGMNVNLSGNSIQGQTLHISYIA